MNTSLRCAVLGAVVVLIAPRPADASCVPGFDYGAFSDGPLVLGGGSVTDSYDSSAGSYTETKTLTGGDVCTNATGANSVRFNGSGTQVYGNVCVGDGGNPSTDINATPTQYLTSSALPVPGITLTPVTIPVTGTYQGHVTPCNPCTIAPNQTYGDVTVKGRAQLNAGVYVMKSLDVQAGGYIDVVTGPIVIYIQGPKTPNVLEISGDGVTNASLKATNLVFMVGAAVGCGVKVNGGATAAFAVYAPLCDIDVAGNGTIYGAIVGANVGVSGGAAIHYDQALGSFAGNGFPCTATEITRSSPVVALITPSTGSPQTALVQGTFESPTSAQTIISSTGTAASVLASVTAFRFPYLKGHMRARVASSITTTTSSYSSGTVMFDVGAAGSIPDPNYTGCATRNGTCRHIFTNTNGNAADGRTFRPSTVVLSDATSATVGALIAPASVITGITAAHWQVIVRRVLNAKLGGVDRSTAAVIQASGAAGVNTRPTIAYFGGSDGMLHAACASVGGITPSGSNICPALGRELWAFIPRVQLPLIRSNTARIDGSVRVQDVFGDFNNDPATGTKSFRTILTFQTGFAVGTQPATYAFDITDPAAPVLLWEVTAPTSVGSTELGVGLTVAAGPVRILGQLTNLAVVQTNNGGTGGAGVVVTALQQETGRVKWEFSYLSPTVAVPYRAAVDTPHPAQGIPGGAVGVDLLQQGTFTDFVFGDLFGNLWRVNAVDGTSRNGTDTPLFSFTTNRHPIGTEPAIYSNGSSVFAAFASGGFVHATAADWNNATQYVIAAKLSGTGAPVSEATSACPTCALTVNSPLAAGFKGFAQALVVGSQLFVTSDSSDINAATFGTTTGVNTGNLSTFDLTGVTSSTTVVIPSGAATLANDKSTGKLYVSSSSGQKDLNTLATTSGASVDLEATKPVTRNLWLRSE